MQDGTEKLHCPVMGQSSLKKASYMTVSQRKRKVGVGMEKYYLAIDIGASSGRHILSHMENGKMVLEEIHRFPNGMEESQGQKVWNVDVLFQEIEDGMKKCAELGNDDAVHIDMTMDEYARESQEIFCTMKEIAEAVENISKAVEESANGVTNAAANVDFLVQSIAIVRGQMEENSVVAGNLKEEAAAFINV